MNKVRFKGPLTDVIFSVILNVPDTVLWFAIFKSAIEIFSESKPALIIDCEEGPILARPSTFDSAIGCIRIDPTINAEMIMSARSVLVFLIVEPS